MLLGWHAGFFILDFNFIKNHNNNFIASLSRIKLTMDTQGHHSRSPAASSLAYTYPCTPREAIAWLTRHLLPPFSSTTRTAP
jgi:heat shock protein HspQ